MRMSVVLTAALLASPLLHADEKVKSGRQPGESVGAFPVIDVTGKFQPKSVCYI